MLALAAILSYGGYWVEHGGITIAWWLSCSTRRFFRPIQDLSEKYNILQSAMARPSVYSSCSTRRWISTFLPQPAAPA